MVQTILEEGAQNDLGEGTDITKSTTSQDFSTADVFANLKLKEETIQTLEGEVERLESENAKFHSTYSQYWEKWEVLTQSRKLLAREVTRLRRTVLQNGCRRNSTQSMPELWREMSGGFTTNLDFTYNEDTLGNLSFDSQDLESPFSSFETPPPELSHSVLEGLTTDEPLKNSLKSQTSKAGETKGTSWDVELPSKVSGSSSLFNSLVSDPFASFLLEEKPQKYTTNGIRIPEEGVQETTEGVHKQEEDKLSPLSIIQSSSLDESEHSSAEMQEDWLVNYSSNGSHSSSRPESREQSNWEALPFPKSSFVESSGNEAYLAKANSLHLEYDKVSYECFDPVFSRYLLSENVNICVKPEVTPLEKELALSITVEENHFFQQPQRSNLFIQSRASWISFTDKASPKSVSFSSTKSLTKEGLKCERETFQTRNRVVRRGPRLLSKKILSPGNSEDSVPTVLPSRVKGFEAPPPSHGYIRSLAQELVEQPSPRPLRESTNKNPKISVLSTRRIKNKDSKVEAGKRRSVRTRRSATLAKSPQDCIKCHRILESNSLGSSSVRKRSGFTKVSNNSARSKFHETNKPKRVAIKQNTGLSQRPQTGYALGLSTDRQGKPHSDFTRNPDLNPNIKIATMKYPSRVSNKSETKIKHSGGRKLERLTNKRLVPYSRNVLRRSDQDVFTYTESKSPNLRLQIDPYGESRRANPQGESPRCMTFRETSHPVIPPDKFILNTSKHSYKPHLKINDRYKRYPDNNEEYLKLSRNICPAQRCNNVRDRRSHIKIGKLTIWEKVEGCGERISGRRVG